MLKIRTSNGNLYFMTADELTRFSFSFKLMGGYTILAYIPGRG